MQFQGGADADRQVAEMVQVRFTDVARLAVHDAERPQGVAVGRQDRGSRVEAKAEVTGHVRVVDETRVLRGIGDAQRFGRVQDRVRAKRGVARQLGHPTQTDAGLVPLSVRVDERDRGDRDREQAPGHAGENIERLGALRVHDAEGREGRETFGFVGGQVGGWHRALRNASARHT